MQYIVGGRQAVDGWTEPEGTAYSYPMPFRDRLMATIAAARPVLEAPDVVVAGSEVPNLLQPDAASTLVVSQDLRAVGHARPAPTARPTAGAVRPGGERRGASRNPSAGSDGL
jgi:hypothetical protein